MLLINTVYYFFRKDKLDFALKEVDRQKEEAVIIKRAKDVAEAQAEEAR